MMGFTTFLSLLALSAADSGFGSGHRNLMASAPTQTGGELQSIGEKRSLVRTGSILAIVVPITVLAGAAGAFVFLWQVTFEGDLGAMWTSIKGKFEVVWEWVKSIFSGDKDACRPNPCQNDGQCTAGSEASSYTCQCATGFSGKNCEKDSCLPEGKNFCQNDGKCTRGESSPTCKCAPKFTGKKCEDGRKTITRDGVPCVKWNSYFTKQQYSYHDDNFCRNPDKDPKSWCVTSSNPFVWGYCEDEE